MKQKLLAAALIVTLGLSLTACGTDSEAEASSAEETAVENTETAEAEEAEAAETETEETEVVETAPAVTARAEWTLDDIAKFAEAVTGITDREYEAGKGANYKIYEDISYNRDIVYTVLFNTAGVRFDEPGEYGMTYWIYFNVAALNERTNVSDLSVEIPDADRLAVTVHATVTVGDPEETEDDEGAEELADTDSIEASIKDFGGSSTASASSGSSTGSSSGASKSSGSSGSSGNSSNSSNSSASSTAYSSSGGNKSSGGSSSAGSGSSKSSGSSSSSGSGGSGSSGSSSSSAKSSGSSSSSSSSSTSTTCDHDWVAQTETVSHDEVGHYETTDVREGRYVCNNCGASFTTVTEVGNHCFDVCNGCGYSVKSVVVGTEQMWVVDQAAYTETVTTGYKCSKCGATK